MSVHVVRRRDAVGRAELSTNPEAGYHDGSYPVGDGRALDRPWLSVIVPCRNGQRWLTAALQSIVDQKEQGIEVIFADGSADNASLDIVNTFSHRLNVRAFRRTDLSWMARTNLGVEQARGDLICMLHVDDLWMPNKCAKLREWVSVAPDAVMHVHSSYIIDETGKRLGIWRCPLPSDVPQFQRIPSWNDCLCRISSPLRPR
jgi:glycosyltransferase involved in cell wall biosynthesis